MQRADGAAGAFVVRKPKSQDQHGTLYDYDRSEHTMIVTDWIHELSVAMFTNYHHSSGDSKPPNLLINGFGRFKFFNDSAKPIYMKAARFNVEQISSKINTLPRHHHHHQSINVLTAGAQAFPMDGIGRLCHDPAREPSTDWRVLTTADAAGTNGLKCLPKHEGTRDRRFLVTHPMTDHCESCLTSTIAAEFAHRLRHRAPRPVIYSDN
ncbi:hypothetical protein evm_009662 [Chilo suppressalis]|nr:hypothetical protein evm_009662 [Chilo suppressalis]